ncbi:hypothetical protein RvY_03516 [Ramazzottius varieornatus]|uniref:Neurotransmitter-gated ion-channel ligand-binding domain-containing protein n=1 Tax=Ramazzottius varieornatus TaxID=947166 RepID=A0A1D1UND8_RAMVA|nr:hypothetical protein RvY_03516 [Ramazzottius varieornatus]
MYLPAFGLSIWMIAAFGIVSSLLGRCRAYWSPTKLFNSLMEGYDREEWPTFNVSGLPTLVKVQVDILAIATPTLCNTDYTIRFLLVQQWLDPRLAYTVDNGTRPLELHRLDNIERMWLPDTYMVNAKLAFWYDVTVPQRYVQIRPDGLVTYAARVTANLICRSVLFPLPSPETLCEVHLASFGYTADKVQLQWHWEAWPVAIVGDLELPDYVASAPKLVECLMPLPIGPFSCLRTKIKFRQIPLPDGLTSSFGTGLTCDQLAAAAAAAASASFIPKDQTPSAVWKK